jgi:hypothetical protein
VPPCLQAYFNGSYDLPSATLEVLDDQATTSATPTAAISMALELSSPTSSSLSIFDAKTAPLTEASGVVQTQTPGEFASELFTKIASSIFADVPTDFLAFIAEFYLITGPAPLMAFLVATMPTVRVCG